MKTKKKFKTTVLIVVLLSVAVTLSACSGQQLSEATLGQTAARPNYWVIAVDTTAPSARIGGTYEEEIMASLAQAAREQATIYAAPVDGNAISDATWTINGERLATTAGGGNAQLAEAARVRLAQRLRPKVRQLLGTHPTNGSDLIGGLLRVAQLSRDLPGSAPKTLVLLTDGAIDLSPTGGYDIETSPPDTQAERASVIAALKRTGEFPHLAGWNVYLGGIGVGLHNRTTARAVIATWEALVPAMGAHLVEINSTLSLH